MMEYSGPLIQYDCGPYKKRRKTQRGEPMWRQTHGKTMGMQTKGGQGLVQTLELKEARKDSPYRFQREDGPADTMILEFSSPKL